MNIIFIIMIIIIFILKLYFYFIADRHQGNISYISFF